MGASEHFTRDTELVHDVADQFGGGGGNAENLVEANSLRYSEELTAAQLLPAESTRTEDDLAFSREDVANAAELDEKEIVGWDVHGDYVVFAFETSDKRVHKDVLQIDGDSLEQIEGHDSPQRAALRAQVAATAKVREAQTEADDIIAKAQAEADEILAKAAAEAEEARVEKVEEAQKEAVREGDRQRAAAEKAEKARTSTSKAQPKSGQNK